MKQSYGEMQLEKQRLEQEIQQIQNRDKILKNKISREERKLRARRLIERGAMLESVFPALKERDNAVIMNVLVAFSRLPQAAEIVPKLERRTDTESPSLGQGRTYTP